MSNAIDLTIFKETACGLIRQLGEAAVDHRAFEQALPHCELTRCRATCCHDGVVLSEEEADVLRSLGGDDGVIVREDGQLGTKVISARSEQLGEDYPDNFPQTRCVFLDEEHRCKWQLKAVEEGKHPWFYKPISCWLHPVLIDQRDGRALVTIRSEANDQAKFATSTPCGRATEGARVARESLAMELEMLGKLSGRDFYGELNAPPGFSERT